MQCPSVDAGAEHVHYREICAVLRAFPGAPRNLVANLQFSTASTDFMHHFDGQYHFDGSSTATHPERFAK